MSATLRDCIYGFEGIPQEWISALKGKDAIDVCLFEKRFGSEEPNALTLAAIAEANDMIVNGGGESYASAEEMFKAIGL